jgi:hypothetical protein
MMRVLEAWADDATWAAGVPAAGGGGALDGYIAYKIHAPTNRPQRLVVDELVAVTDEAERALLGYLAALEDQFDEILMDTPREHPLPAILRRGLPAREGDDLPDEHHPAGELTTGAMARIVDLPAALTGRGWPKISTKIGVAIDGQPPVVLSLDDGVPSVADGEHAGIRGAIGPITQIVTGALRLGDAVRYGLVAGDPVSEPIFALPPPYPLPIF